MNIKKSVIHFTGILGQGMAALAEILKACGARIVGSDTKTESFTTDAVLKAARIPVHRFAASNITLAVQKVIYSTAYDANRHPELIKARNLGIPIQSYGEALAELFNSFARRILVTGTHGKSTTTAMIGYILTEAGYDPTVIVGGNVLNWNRNSRAGKSEWIVAEGDEYQAKILLMKPTLLVLTAIDYDHPDFFPTRAAYQNMFRKMKTLMPANKIITFKQHEADGITLMYLFGIHNKRNAKLAARTARTVGVKRQIIDRALLSFRGVGRRLEYYKCHPKDARILLDDYAHHPTEIKAALDAVRERYPKRQIVTIFQPHTFSRTTAFFDDFTRSFTKSDVVIFLKTYGSAREKSGVAATEKLALETAKRHPCVRYAATHKKAAKLAAELLREYAVLIAMGAGDVNHVLSFFSMR